MQPKVTVLFKTMTFVCIKCYMLRTERVIIELVNYVKWGHSIWNFTTTQLVYCFHNKLAVFECILIMFCALLNLGTILFNSQLDALLSKFLFISPLYMFRTAQCSSSGDRLYQYIIWYVLVYVGDCLVCRSGGNLLTGIPSSHLHRLIRGLEL